MKKINNDKLTSLITSHAFDDISQGKLGGAEIAVTQDGERVFHETFGDSRPGEALREGQIYRIASMTKPVTTVAVLKLAGEGKIDLNAPIEEYYPSLAPFNVGIIENKKIIPLRKATGTVRVFNLLCHTSGIGTSPLCEYQNPPEECLTLADAVDYYLFQPLAFDPYTAQSYSPTAAFDVAARIIETVTGEEYDKWLKDNILLPCGMVDTTFNPTAEQWNRMVGMHGRNAEGKSVEIPMTEGRVFGNMRNSICPAGAGLASTLEDYCRFAEMLLNEGKNADGEQIISPDMIRKMRTPHVPESIMPGDVRWGLGVRVITLDTYYFGLARETFGWSGAYGTHFWVDPVNRITAVYMKNCCYDGGAGCRTGNVFEQDVSSSLE